METKHKRSSFSGRLGYVMAVAGSAVGLGNIWRFPYLAAKYGGGTFLFTYFILAITFGFALLISETALGRKKTSIWWLAKCHRANAHRTLLLCCWGMGL